MSPLLSSGVAVDLVALSKEYRSDWRRPPVGALTALQLQVPAGQIYGLIGPNGSGKSTALKLMAGLLRPTAGSCRVGGYAAGSPEARTLVGFLPEAPQFPRFLTAREFLNYCGGLSGLDGISLGQRITEVLAWAGLESVADRTIGTYSKGLAQRLGLAQAVLHDPAIVLLDEPASGLDPIGVRDLTRLILRLKQTGKTVILTSHFLAQMEEVCDRVALLHAGRLLREGPLVDLAGSSGGRLERLYLENIGDVVQ